VLSASGLWKLLQSAARALRDDARAIPAPSVVAPLAASCSAPPAPRVPPRDRRQNGARWSSGWSFAGMAKQLALNCALAEREGNSFHLMLEATHAQMLNKIRVEERIRYRWSSTSALR
jgi:hypothetical protein